MARVFRCGKPPRMICLVAWLACLCLVHMNRYSNAAGLRTTLGDALATTAAPAAGSKSEGPKKLDPEYQAEIDKLNAAEKKVKDAMAVQRSSLAIKKEALQVIQDQEKEAQGKVDEVTKWLQRAQNSIEKIDSRKQAVHIKFDLKRLRPLVGMAAEKKKKLIMETEKIGSAHKEVSSRVAALEAELEELEAGRSEGESGESASKPHLKAESSDTNSVTNSSEAEPDSLDAMLADLTK